MYPVRLFMGPRAFTRRKKRLMRAFKFVLGAVLLSGAVVSAQDISARKFEAALDYSWLHVNSANYDLQRNANGGSGYFEYNLNKTVGLVADLGGYPNTRTGIDDKLVTYLA